MQQMGKQRKLAMMGPRVADLSFADQLTLRQAFGLAKGFRVYRLSDSRHPAYIVDDLAGRYVLKIRPKEDAVRASVVLEHSVQFHLDGAGAPVAPPLSVVRSWPGDRCIVCGQAGLLALYRFIEGEPCRVITEHAFAFGEGLGCIHRLLDDFTATAAPPVKDADQLVEAPTAALSHGFLPSEPSVRARTLARFQTLGQWIRRLPTSVAFFGLCHGDAHHLNARMRPDGRLVIFDFEELALCWRAYDLATFLWGTLTHGGTPDIWDSFIKGYASQRPLDEREVACVTPFMAVRQLWWMGFHAAHWGQWHRSWMNKSFFDEGYALFERIFDELDIDEVLASWS